MRQMTMTSLNPYAQIGAAIRTPRATEHDIIARVTQRLVQADQRKESDFPGLVAALADNDRLWIALGADVAGNANGLPSSLRAQLFSLSRFAVEHSRRVRRREAAAGVLIDINTAVMRGLRGEGGGS